MAGCPGLTTHCPWMIPDCCGPLAVFGCLLDIMSQLLVTCGQPFASLVVPPIVLGQIAIVFGQYLGVLRWPLVTLGPLIVFGPLVIVLGWPQVTLS